MEPYQIVIVGIIVLLNTAIFWTISSDLRRLYKELDLHDQQISGLYNRIYETEKMLKDYDWYIQQTKKQATPAKEVE